MRKIKFLVIAILLGVNTLYSQGIEFYQGTYQEALDLAKSENKYIFIDFYTKSCAPCKWLAKNVFTREDVNEVYKNFICLTIDAEEGNGIELAKKYHVSAYPTLLFINAEEDEIHRKIGSRREYLPIIQLGKDVLNKTMTPYSKLKQQYKDGKNDKAFLKTYLLAQLNSDEDHKVILPVYKKYISMIKGDEFLDEKNFDLFMEVDWDVSSPYAVYFYKNLKSFEDRFEVQFVHNKKAGIRFRCLVNIAYEEDLEIAKEKSAQLMQHLETTKDEKYIINKYKVEGALLKFNNQYEQFANKIQKAFESGEIDKDFENYKLFALTLFRSKDKSNDKYLWKLGFKWLEEAIRLCDPNNKMILDNLIAIRADVQPKIFGN